MRTTADRYHDISCGHRVVGHEGKCRLFHGHNYRVHFVIDAPMLDSVGRKLDFSVIKDRLCMWLEDNWDHRFLMWEKDPALGAMWAIDNSIVELPFNPTAENMAEYLLLVIGPQQLLGTAAQLISVRVEETRKCAAEASL